MSFLHSSRPPRRTTPSRWRITRLIEQLCLVGSLVATGLPGPAAGAAPVPLSDDAERLLVGLRASADPAGAPFIVLDKRQARVWVFDGGSPHPVASAPVLLGLAVGDDSVPGIGERPLSQIAPHERTTPAGRFVLEVGRNVHGEDILWVDYDAAVSMHKVRDIPGERRLERLASDSAVDNRISFGCINVPPAFFDRVLMPMFGPRGGIAYVLPETRAPGSVFPFIEAAAERPRTSP